MMLTPRAHREQAFLGVKRFGPFAAIKSPASTTVMLWSKNFEPYLVDTIDEGNSGSLLHMNDGVNLGRGGNIRQSHLAVKGPSTSWVVATK